MQEILDHSQDQALIQSTRAVLTASENSLSSKHIDPEFIVRWHEICLLYSAPNTITSYENYLELSQKLLSRMTRYNIEVQRYNKTQKKYAMMQLFLSNHKEPLANIPIQDQLDSHFLVVNL
ncbi:hypothetical protein DID78_05295 [Candidatus Marinamargulisbacteria bacterium SCGC AG-343-D04]|nr:hypothetical protein DID78_05295 [Candidatus Marinamargulisbacteria bacterium SCGC AG-343-D04]